jgi:pimeloyl-ACP methyl ester carboxylesterase
MVQDVLATDKKEISGYDDQSTTDIESNTEEILPPKELYCKLASNCELIELYSGINNQLIEQGRASRNFRETTATMLQIKECLKQIEVKVTF